MIPHISIDFETYSEAGYHWDNQKQAWSSLPGLAKKGIEAVGLANYALHPSTEILSMAYDLHDGKDVRLWLNIEKFPAELEFALNSNYKIHAWNSAFEYWLWTQVGVKKHEFPMVSLDRFVCTAAKARAYSLPPKLKNCGEVLKITKQKDKRGDHLIKLLSVPKKPTKKDPETRRYRIFYYEQFKEFEEYNIRDVEAETEINSVVPELSDLEAEYWALDQRINLRGVKVDRDTLENCLELMRQAYAKYNPLLQKITNGYVKKASEVAKIIVWLRTQGINVASLDDDVLEELLISPIPNNVREVLRIRQYLSSAAVKKLYALKYQMTQDDRVHNLFIYYGTRTGRASGAGPQPQNLPNKGPFLLECPACMQRSKLDPSILCPFCNTKALRKPVKWDFATVEKVLEMTKSRDIEFFENHYGEVLTTISGCVRSLFIASKGYDLICADFHSIEAVVLAALAKEEWRLETFRTHGKIYELSASKISGIPFEEFERYKKEKGEHHPLRNSLGKVAELASGYQGWIGAWKNAGANKFLNDEQIEEAVKAWRKANPNIVAFWGGQWDADFNPVLFGLEGCAIQAVLYPSFHFSCNNINFVCKNDILICTLLSGRKLYYHKPQVLPSEKRKGLTLSYESWNTNPKMGKIGWIRLSTYGGKLTENVVQATARDILMNSMLNLDKAGFNIVLHIHDEIVAEVKENSGHLEEFETIMSQIPRWAEDWPIKASGGWCGKRYRKS